MKLSDQLADIQAGLWDGTWECPYHNSAFICIVAKRCQASAALDFLYCLGMTDNTWQFRAGWDAKLQTWQPGEREPEIDAQGCRFMFLEFAYLLALDLEKAPRITKALLREPV